MPALVMDIKIEIQEITLDLLQSTDSPALRDAMQAAIDPSIVDSAGFDNACV